MKLNIRITLSNGYECADLYVNTGEIQKSKVETIYRQVEIPDIKPGWLIKELDIESKEFD